MEGGVGWRCYLHLLSKYVRSAYVCVCVRGASGVGVYVCACRQLCECKGVCVSVYVSFTLLCVTE